MISIMVQVLSWTQTPITLPSPHLRPILQFIIPNPEMWKLWHWSTCPPSKWSGSLGPLFVQTDTPDCCRIITDIPRTSIYIWHQFASPYCQRRVKPITYVHVPGKNWHLMVLNFKFISYRSWVELSTGSVVRGHQQRCGGYGHFRELTWYLNDVHRIIIMFCASPSCIMMIIVRLLNIWHIFSPFWPSLHRWEHHGETCLCCWWLRWLAR